MEKKKIGDLLISDIPRGSMVFVGKGIFIKLLETPVGNRIEVYRRYSKINPKKTLVAIMGFSILLGISLGALMWY